jgi:transcriptional regulator
MYLPPHFRVDDRDSQLGLIRAYPLGLLVTAGAGGLMANPIPFICDPDIGPAGRLRCHVARANAQWREIGEGAPALVVFTGAQHYITPNWYETKRETHKVVPTWNYAMVEAAGRARAVEDAGWLATQIADLTRLMEAHRPDGWAVSDAPEPFIASQIKGIVGIEIELSALTGKWKVSQNRPEDDRAGVIEGLRAEPDPAAAAMAALVESPPPKG